MEERGRGRRKYERLARVGLKEFMVGESVGKQTLE